MELHGENPFKAKAYATAAFKLNKMRYDFSGKSPEDIESIEGIGKGISGKITELLKHGRMSELDELLKKTPPGLIGVLDIKGLGPKKVKQLWDELHVESIGELLYACNENRLVTLKGFGEKTQNQIKKSIEFGLANSNKFHFATIEPALQNILNALGSAHKHLRITWTGEVARKCEVIDKITLLTDYPLKQDDTGHFKSLPLPVQLTSCEPAEFWYRSVELSSAPKHLEKIGFEKLTKKHFSSEEEVYQSLGLNFIPAELREGLEEVERSRSGHLPVLIEPGDLKGVLHCHSTYSDGVHTLHEMAESCRQSGFQYFGICDHSRSAFYANGLDEKRIQDQHHEIEKLNSGYQHFRILKGIESDILNDGSLDYSDLVLKSFDFVVASVHSNLKMDEHKATSRLIRAIENPFTSILGHPTGRLLLARPGYPIDHKKVIDACAANGVHIELNAHPYRLDIDWRWIPYCIEKGVLISINPDAHHKDAIGDMRYGVYAARKGMLSKEGCLNTLNLSELIVKFGK